MLNSFLSGLLVLWSAPAILLRVPIRKWMNCCLTLGRLALLCLASPGFLVVIGIKSVMKVLLVCLVCLVALLVGLAVLPVGMVLVKLIGLLLIVLVPLLVSGHLMLSSATMFPLVLTSTFRLCLVWLGSCVRAGLLIPLLALARIYGRKRWMMFGTALMMCSPFWTIFPWKRMCKFNGIAFSNCWCKWVLRL